MKPHDVQQVMDRARDAVSVGRIFGAPYEKGGVTVLPAARIRGGGGGGAQDGGGPRRASGGQGLGGGFGMMGRPAGVFVIRGDTVRWLPAVDPGLLLVPLAMIVVVTLRARRRRRRREWARAEWARRMAPPPGEEQYGPPPEAAAGRDRGGPR